LISIEQHCEDLRLELGTYNVVAVNDSALKTHRLIKKKA